MKQLIFLCILCGQLLLGPQALAQGPEAQCYAEYKARKGPPLKLHYGVMALEGVACERRRRAKAEVTDRLAVDDWEVLKLMAVFEVGDTVTRREFRKMETDAGRYFLRY